MLLRGIYPECTGDVVLHDEQQLGQLVHDRVLEEHVTYQVFYERPSCSTVQRSVKGLPYEPLSHPQLLSELLHPRIP